MPKTMDQWVSFLTERMDKARPRIDRLRGYTNGNAPLPEMGPNLRKSWAAFQRRALANSAALIVDSLAERIHPNGILVGNSPDSPLAEQARRIWRDNRLDVAFQDAARDAFTVGVGYMLETVDDNGEAVVTRERPEQFYAEPDPVRPWKARAAVKVWRTMSDHTDHMVVWVDGVCAEYARDSYGRDAKLIERVRGDWNITRLSEYAGDPPVILLVNKDEMGEFEAHTGIIDRINTGILYRLVTMAMQTYRQRALKASSPDAPGLPDTDEKGDQIDYQAIFEPGPGALWELPPGVEIWESQTVDLTPMLSAVKDDWRELAGATRTPLSAMLPDAANQSASGAEQPMAQLVSKAEDRIRRFKPALAVMLVRALQIEGAQLDGATVEAKFAPPATISMTERYAAAAQARGAGEALETIQENILGYSPEQIAQDKQRRAEEQMALALGLQAAQGVTPQPKSGGQLAPIGSADVSSRAARVG
ncbi:phage portal protein [Schaalia sp. 19OD2882]|uniref:phage portal protein n=1 Tax=Schaalia sp. 19OD2882 TaxID=2794089 RepID=UPI001C1ECCBE|nr:phage portal protein [Schaalia sp. 19OD2882]QWW20138.1 phage portal protein [Schaalia sp. 19OD2882]